MMGYLFGMSILRILMFGFYIGVPPILGNYYICINYPVEINIQICICLPNPALSPMVSPPQ